MRSKNVSLTTIVSQDRTSKDWQRVSQNSIQSMQVSLTKPLTGFGWQRVSQDSSFLTVFRRGKGKKFQASRQRERRCSQDLLLGEGVQYAEPLFLFWLSSGVVLGLEPNTGSRADYTCVREFIPFGIELPDQGLNIYTSPVQEGRGFRAKRGESAG